jgi:hypothetical protein
MNALFVVVSLVVLLLAGIPAALLWRSRPARLAVLGIAWFGGLSIVLQALGGLASATGGRALTATNMLLGSAVVCAASWATRRATAGTWVSRDTVSLRGWLPSTGTAGRRSTLVPLAVALGAGLVFLVCAASSALSAPPRGWDVLSYHLPRAASWMLHGGFDTYGGTGAFYPGNAEFLLLSALFTGSDRLAPLIQLPFAGLAAASLYGLSRLLGASRRTAAVPVAVLVLSPMLFFQATVAKDDLVVMALVLAAGFFALRSLPDGRCSAATVRDATVAGLALGLAVGTKYSILPFAVLSVPIFFALHLAAPAPERGARRLRGAASATGVLIAGMLVPSAFWFIRNALATGNPLAPLPTTLGEWTASIDLKQQAYFVPSERAWIVFPWLDRHIGSTYSGSAGYGAAFGAFFLPGLIVCAASVFDGRNARALRVRRLGLLVLIVACGAAWWVGRHHLPRFLWPAAALATAGIGVLFRSVTAGARRVLVGVLAAGVLFSCAETLRIAFREDDVTWSHQGGVGREEFYQIPKAVYRLPSGTKILLVKRTGHDFYQTYRYPLVGNPPGNDVVMEADIGLEIDVARDGALAAYPQLRAAGVDYVFMRFFGKRATTTPFDAQPSLYPRLIDTVQMSYPWYRESFAVSPDGAYLGPGFVTTKFYRVSQLRRDP